MNELKDYIEGLEKWLLSNKPIPEWDTVLIGDESDFYQEGKLKIEIKLLSSIDGYEQKFTDLLNDGYSWINLSAIGVQNKHLLVCVEKPAYPSGAGKEQISINYSGALNAL